MEVLWPIASSLFVIGLLSALLLLARRAAMNKPLSFGALGRPQMLSFARRPDPGADDQKSLRVLRQAALTPSHRVHLLLVADQRVLLCTHPQGCTVIPTVGGEVERCPRHPEDRNQSCIQQAGERNAG